MGALQAAIDQSDHRAWAWYVKRMHAARMVRDLESLRGWAPIPSDSASRKAGYENTVCGYLDRLTSAITA